MLGKLEQEIGKRQPFESPQEAAVVGLLRTHDLIQYRFGRLFREHGLSQPQYNILRILRGEGKPLPCLEIGRRMIAKVPAITHLIDKLEKRELVRRSRCEKDRRVWYVSLTEAGRALVGQLDEPVRAMDASLCTGLSDDECRELVRLMDKARDGIRTTT